MGLVNQYSINMIARVDTMTFKATFLLMVLIGVMLTACSHLLNLATEQSTLLMTAFVLRFLLMVFQESSGKEEYLMLAFVLISLIMGGNALSANGTALINTLNIVAIFVGYAAAVYLARLRVKHNKG